MVVMIGVGFNPDSAESIIVIAQRFDYLRKTLCSKIAFELKPHETREILSLVSAVMSLHLRLSTMPVEEDPLAVVTQSAIWMLKQVVQANHWPGH